MSASVRCLKEYTCFEYENMIRRQFDPVKSSPSTLKFKGNTPYIFQELKYEIIDRLHSDGQEKLYICKWEVEVANSTSLYFFDFKLNHLKRISMVGRPKFLNIVADHIYIMAGSELVLLCIDRLEVVRTYPLGMDTIHAIQPAFKQSDLNSRGVVVYSWNQRQGYTKRFYSPSESHEQKWWSSLTNTILLKKAPQQLLGSELKIIIPNVLGILILSSLDQICLMNLATMQPVSHCLRKLSNWSLTKASKAIIKYYVNQSSNKFDDSLLISLAEKDQETIEVFVFHIKYLPQVAAKIKALKQENSGGEMGLPSITTGQVVDWNASVLQNFFCYCTEGGLIDYLLVEKGLIFYSDADSKIPSSGFINYHSPLHLNPILALEHNICQSFAADSELLSQITELKKRKESGGDSYEQNELISYYEDQLVSSTLKPNRYSLQFIYATLGVERASQITGKVINVKSLFLNWHKAYRIKRIVKFDGDILVLRQNSVTSFLSIDQKQFVSEFEKGEQLDKFLQVVMERNSVTNFDLSINDSNYSFNFPIFNHIPSDSIWKQINDYHDTAFTYEKEGTYFNKPDGDISANEFCENYKKYFQIFVTKISTRSTQTSENIFQWQQITLKSQIFSKMLIHNRVKDILNFYCKLLRYLFAKTRDYHRQEYKPQNLGQKQKTVISYLSELAKLINQPWHQICAHGADLVQIFVGQEINSLFSNIDQQRGADQNLTVFVNVEKQSWKIISRFFEEVIVVTPKSTQVNNFIKLLLNYIKSGFEYIQYILLDIFNPYSNSLLDQSSFEGTRSSSLLNCPDEKPIHSNEQNHYPVTSTLLSIYCFLPVSDDIQDKLITSCILPTLLAQNSEKSINQLLTEVIGSKNFKDRIRIIYTLSKEICKKQNQFKFSDRSERMRFSSDRSERMRFSSDRSERDFSKRRVDSEHAQIQELDSSLGIVELAKLLEPEVLQSKLLELTEGELDSVFRGNLEALLEGRRDEQINYSIEEILIGWIFKYRTYLNKYRNLLHSIANTNSEVLKQPITNNNCKRFAIMYANYCMSSLSNIKNYYTKLYANLKAVLPSQKNDNPQQHWQQQFQAPFNEENGWETIEKICCRMLGYPSSHGLYLYEETDKVRGNEEYFTLVLPLLKDVESYAQSIISIDSILFYYLIQITEDTQKLPVEVKADLLKRLGKYRSRKQLSEFIMKNGVLRSNFENLENPELVGQLRDYFPNWDQMGFTIGRISPNQNVQSQKRQQKQRARPQVREYQDEEDSKEQNRGYVPHQRLPFRNSYLEAVGR